MDQQRVVDVDEEAERLWRGEVEVVLEAHQLQTNRLVQE